MNPCHENSEYDTVLDVGYLLYLLSSIRNVTMPLVHIFMVYMVLDMLFCILTPGCLFGPQLESNDLLVNLFFSVS